LVSAFIALPHFFYQDDAYRAVKVEKCPVIPYTQPELVLVIAQRHDVAGVWQVRQFAYRILDSDLLGLIDLEQLLDCLG
jgi:hypothetical protein